MFNVCALSLPPLDCELSKAWSLAGSPCIPVAARRGTCTPVPVVISWKSGRGRPTALRVGGCGGAEPQPVGTGESL